MNFMLMTCVLLVMKGVELAIQEGMTWDRYHTAAEIDRYVDYLGRNYPQYVTVFQIGYSYEGRPLKVLKISSGIPNAKKIWIDGGIHAREWISPAAVTFILREIIENRKSYGEHIQGIDFYVMPQMNPDGYEYSRNINYMWRKNRRKTSFNCLGVDLNRNWEYHAERFNQTQRPCNEIYPGPYPLSEPETKAVANFLHNNFQNMGAFLTFHSFGQKLMYPYGYTKTLPNDYKDLERVGRKAAKNVKNSGGPHYSVYNDYAHDGVASYGGLDDYAKEVLGIKYSYTVELRDTGKYAFFLPENLILQTGIDALAIVDTIAGEVYYNMR